MIKLWNRLLDSRSLVSGSALYVGYRWFDRFLGVISLAILARLLEPESFGIVAMASIVLGLLEAVFDMGIHVLVLQKDKPNKSFLNTAWTLRFLQSVVIGLIIAGFAPIAADYFSEPRVTSALYVLAIASVVYGFENFAVVQFQKSRQFFKEFQLSAIKRITMFFIVITLAFVLESYWALIFGTLISRAMGVFLSYLFYPVVHRFSFKGMGEIFGSGKWLLIMNVITYFCRRLDEIIIGRYFSSAALGNYTVASEVARLPTQELMAPISRALLPGFTSMKHDKEETRKLIYSSINTQASLALPAALGLAICAQQIVQIFLGQQWVLAGNLLTLLPFLYAAAAVRYTGEYYLIAHEKQKLLSGVGLYYLLSFVSAIAIGNWYFHKLTLEYVIYSRIAIELSGVVLMWYLTARISGIVTVWGQISRIARPLLSALIMFFVLLNVEFDFSSTIISLACTVGLGGITYIVSMILIWLVSGRPDGFERWIYGRLAA